MNKHHSLTTLYERNSMTHVTKTVCTRRRFLATTAATGAVAPTFIPARVMGLGGAVPPSDTIRIAGIGIESRGTTVLQTMLPHPDVRFVAIADVRADRRKSD